MNSDKAAARLDVTLQGRLLIEVQNVAGRAQENDCFVLREVRVGEHGCILRRIESKVVRCCQALDGGDAVGDRIVPKARGLGEDEDLVILGLTMRQAEYAAGKDQRNPDGPSRTVLDHCRKLREDGHGAGFFHPLPGSETRTSARKTCNCLIRYHGAASGIPQPLLGWVSVRVGGKRGLVDAKPAPHRPADCGNTPWRTSLA